MKAAARLRRHVNRRLYRALATLYRTAFLRGAPRGPAVPEAVRRVLVVRHDRLGDLVVTTPLLAFLRETVPHADVDVLASPDNAPLAAGDPRVARVIVRERGWRGWLRTRRECRARGYDLVLSVIEGRGLREGLIAAAFAPSAARRVTTPRGKRYHGLFTRYARAAVRRTHMADRVLAVGTAAFGRPPAPDGTAARRYPYLVGSRPAGEARAAAFAAEHGRGSLVAVNAWAGEPHREIGGARMAELLVTLTARHPGMRFVLAPPPQHQPDAEAAARLARAQGAYAVVYPTSAHALDVVALLRRAAALVTPDTGLVHLAAAAGCPVVALYSLRSSRPERWAPLGVPSRLLVAPDEAPVAAIPLAAVADAFDALWSEVGRGRH